MGGQPSLCAWNQNWGLLAAKYPLHRFSSNAANCEYLAQTVLFYTTQVLAWKQVVLCIHESHAGDQTATRVLQKLTRPEGFLLPTQIMQKKQGYFGPYHFTCMGTPVVLVIAVWLEESCRWDCTRVNSTLSLSVRSLSLLQPQILPDRNSLALSAAGFHCLTIIFQAEQIWMLKLMISASPWEKQKTVH